jgi:hypothetical protein
MALLAAMVLVVGYVIFLNGLAKGLSTKPAAALRTWLRQWTIKGLIVPFFIWLVFNSGLSSRFPPLIPRIDLAPAGAARFYAFVDVAAIGLLIIGTYWAAMSAGWLAAILWEGAEHRQEFNQIAVGWSILLVPAGVLICIFGGRGLAGAAVAIWLSPIVRAGFGLMSVSKTPLYSRAIAKMHSDKYEEAETAVIEELEKCEEDFDGWMMLAELYANHFGDLEGAERLIRESCNQPATTPSQFAVAFHRLADWHLKIAADPAAARRALEEIRRRHPNSHLEHMARLRMDQLPASREELLEQRETKPVPLPALSCALDYAAAADAPTPSRNQAALRANQCVAKLKQNPDNMSAREELARIFTEQLDKVDLGIEQLRLLLTIKEQPGANAAQWLALLGAWQIKYKHDLSAGRRTLEQLLSDYPRSPQAFAARRRLNLMDVETKQQTARANAGDPARELKIRI